MEIKISNDLELYEIKQICISEEEIFIEYHRGKIIGFEREV